LVAQKDANPAGRIGNGTIGNIDVLNAVLIKEANADTA
jgi:hypothetical protein